MLVALQDPNWVTVIIDPGDIEQIVLNREPGMREMIATIRFRPRPGDKREPLVVLAGVPDQEAETINWTGRRLSGFIDLLSIRQWED